MRDSDAPGRGAFAITKSDSTIFAKTTRALYIGTAGDVAVRMTDQTALTFTSVPAGALLPIRVDQVKATGTTASNIIGLY